MKSIFKIGDDWVSKMLELTPVEQKSNGTFFKRDDYFAPNGYGGINGSKLRQCIWLVNNHVKKSGKGGTLFSAASVLSPQLPMSTAVAKYFDMNAVHVIGATKPETALKRPMVNLAHQYGAEFYFAKVGYNPYIQKRVRDIYENKDDSKNYYLKYGITVNNEDDKDEVFGFHNIGGIQVQNIPDNIERLVLPSGSCNSTISILLGIYLFRPKSLKEVWLCGIGPDKMKFIKRRLEQCSQVLGEDVEKVFNPRSKNISFGNRKGAINIMYENIINSGWTTYDKRVRYHYDGIDFHPNYEGKVMKYVNEKYPEAWGDKTMFWIVGSEPKMNIVNNKLKVYGNELQA